MGGLGVISSGSEALLLEISRGRTEGRIGVGEAVLGSTGRLVLLA